MAKKGLKLFETRYFGLVIGVIVFFVIFLLSSQTVLIRSAELGILDFNFRLKNISRRTRVQEGVTLQHRDPRVSPDIMIIGIDDKSLDRFGRWPFPRNIHANLVSGLARIKNQNERERSLFLDIFFVEPSAAAEQDAILVDSIAENNRVFLETILTRNENPPGTESEYLERQLILYKSYGQITDIKGEWTRVESFYGLIPPLKPFARAAYGYGHPNFVEDEDEVYRRQPLVVKQSVLLDELSLEDLKAGMVSEEERRSFIRLSWIDKQNLFHDVPYPLDERALSRLKTAMEKNAPFKVEDTNNDGKPDRFYHVLRKYQDHFMPSVTLALALDYFNRKLSDAEVVLGSFIRIPDPRQFNPRSGAWEPYRLLVRPAVLDKEGGVVREAVTRPVHEIRIPINDKAQMLINFMGDPSTASPDGHQTFPLRSYSGYAAAQPPRDPTRWPATKAVGNKILMVGSFAKGIAEDEKTTPFGLMYGVEIHANALNTIIMNNFLGYLPKWAETLILFAAALLTAFLASRLSTVWSLVLALILIVVHFFTVTLVFDLANIVLPYTAPAMAILLTFLAVIVYRIMTEEKDKRRIKAMFGKYVSPNVVEQILANPPELGGVDRDLTVFFSDIRGFTTLSESMTPQELVNHLNLYLTAMTDIILSYYGTLDKYVGDEIMCFWGAPLAQPDHAMLACKCALSQMQALEGLNREWPAEKRINIGIGINSGIMTVGNMGSPGRMNYTLTGDNVNLAARLEGTNKEYKTRIIISEYTFGLVKDRVTARELDNIRVKGKNRPVLIYELVDVLENLEPPALSGSGGDGKGRKKATVS